MSESTVSVPDPQWESDGYVVQDRTGYNVEAYNIDTPNASPYFVITRESDHTGIGAYGSPKATDDAIARDRDWVTSNTDTETVSPDTQVFDPPISPAPPVEDTKTQRLSR